MANVYIFVSLMKFTKDNLCPIIKGGSLGFKFVQFFGGGVLLTILKLDKVQDKLGQFFEGVKKSSELCTNFIKLC